MEEDRLHVTLSASFSAVAMELPLLCRIIMVDRIQPIAALTADDRGPINTIVSIFLPITSVLIEIIRTAMRKHMLCQFEPDNIVFQVGLVCLSSPIFRVYLTDKSQCFGIFTSILSQFCVNTGLGRHQEMLKQEHVVQYFERCVQTVTYGLH